MTGPEQPRGAHGMEEADEQSADKVAATVIGEDGREVAVMVSEIDMESALEHVTFGQGTGDEVSIEESAGGVAKLALRIFDDVDAAGIPIGARHSHMAVLTPGPLWWIPKLDGSPFGVLAVDEPGRLLPADGEDAIPYGLAPVEGTNGLLAVFDGDEPLGIDALIFGIAYVRGSLAVYDRIRQDETEADEPEEVTLAQYKTDAAFVNHSFALKVFNGLYDIAFGAPYYEITPKKSGSAESYRLTASVDACSRFFYECGGNVEQLKDVLETVYMLRTDKRSGGFLCNGRVWFTVNTIVEEMRRTTGGTVSAKDYPNDRRIVDSALLAASGAQIVGTRPDGKPTNIMYALNAVRRDAVVFNGIEYHDVWGFIQDAATINDYAREIKQTHIYPLLMAKRPLTIDEAWVDRYLRDKLNIARGKLYKVSKNGTPCIKSTRVRKYPIEISWDSIFETASPMKALNSRQKQKVVKTFEKILGLQAEMERKGEMREGMPLYIEAYSERDSTRGRGKGAWVKLVIECSRDLLVPKVDLS